MEECVPMFAPHFVRVCSESVGMTLTGALFEIDSCDAGTRREILGLLMNLAHDADMDTP